MSSIRSALHRRYSLRIPNCMIAWFLYRMGSLLTISHTFSEATSRSSLRSGEPLQIACPIVLQVKEHFYELRHIVENSASSRKWRLTAKSTICQSLCRRTFHFASSEFCKKPCKIRQNTVGYGTSKLNCGERRVRFISRLATPALALTSMRQRRAEGLASSAWRRV
jgi:hypothetical protein